MEKNSGQKSRATVSLREGKIIKTIIGEQRFLGLPSLEFHTMFPLKQKLLIQIFLVLFDIRENRNLISSIGKFSRTA
jgi:hypothetical protein